MKTTRTDPGPAAFPVEPGMAAARAQVLEQQIASGLFKGRALEDMKSELETLRRLCPRA